MSHELDELDLLIAEVRTAEAEAAEAKAAQSKLRRGLLHGDDSAALRATIARYEEKHVWRAIAQVLLIQRQHCSCGAVHHFSQGTFLRQAHVRDTHLARLVVNDWPNCALPKRTEYHDSSCNICVACAGEWQA